MNKIDKSYSNKSSFWAREDKEIASDFLVRPKVLKLLGDIRNKLILDAGCGQGYFSRILSRAGAQVYAFDNIRRLVETAKMSGSKNIDYSVGDVRALKFEDKIFDAVVSIIVLQHLSSKGVISAIQETSRVIKNGGQFILAIPHPIMFMSKMKSGWISFDYDTISYWNKSQVKIALFSKDKKKFNTLTYTHPLSLYINTLSNNNFVIKKIYEARPSKRDMNKCSEMWGQEKDIPSYLIISCLKSF